MKGFSFRFSLVPLVAVLVVSLSFDTTAQTISKAKRDSLMAMSLHDFDQTQKGWRQFKDNVPLMIDLLTNYMAINKTEEEILTWHLGQLYATNNEYEKAIQEMIKTLRPIDGTQDELNRSWNFYVIGTIAFLKNDGNTLSRYADSLANNPVSMNIEVLRRLEKNIGKSYKNSY